MAELYGTVAEFETPEALMEAVEAAKIAGYRKLEAHTPFPVHGLARALGHRRTGIAPIVLAGAIVGAGGAYLLQYYALAIDYPINVGGRPLNSWPAFVPIVFELSVLGAAIFGFIGMLLLNRLPEPYHPVFSAPNFGRASIDRFFLVVQAEKEQAETIRRFLTRHGALQVSEVYR